MINTAMVRAGLRHLGVLAPEALYLETGIDLTRPTEIRARLTERCNYKCLQCACWRFDPKREMTIDQWKSAFTSLLEFLGPFTVQFVGGEPFVKKGFLDLLEFCSERSIDFGVITNGSAFSSDRVVERFVAARPFKVEISVDGPTPELHDRLRGVPGSLASITRGIGKLRSAQSRLGVKFPLRIKTTLNAVNLRAMPEMVAWAESRGADSLDIEPIQKWTLESQTELWPQPDDVDDLRAVVARLIEMRAAGARIETPARKLSTFADHFLEGEAAKSTDVCRIGLRVFGIDFDGRVESCSKFGKLGDLKVESAREIWTGAAARSLRGEMAACREGCTYGCRATKPTIESLKRGLMIFGLAGGPRLRPNPVSGDEASRAVATTRPENRFDVDHVGQLCQNSGPETVDHDDAANRRERVATAGV